MKKTKKKNEKVKKNLTKTKNFAFWIRLYIFAVWFKENKMGLFETRKPRRFEYKPRFYDPNKEQLEQLKAKYGEIEGESYKRRIDFRSAMKEKKEDKIGKPASLFRVFLIATIITGLLYFLLNYVEKWQ